MADKTVSDLTSATTLDGTELFYLIQSANSRKVAGSEIVKIGHNQAWSTITSTPTTLSGYGITDAQPLDSDLTAIAALANTDGNFIVGNGTAWTVESGATARTSLGLGSSATTDATDYATAAQGTTADSALQPGDIGTTVQAQGATLDSLEGLTLASGDVLYASAADTLANLAKGTEGQVLKVSATGIPEWGTVAGTGDMLAATYDPTSIAGDAFDMANMVEATDAKVMTAAERTSIAGAVQPTATDASGFGFVLDEDDMASDSATKVPTQQSVKYYQDANTVLKVDNRAALKALDTAVHSTAYLREGVPALFGRFGTFAFDGSDLSAEVTADTQEGIYIAPDSDSTGASGAWVRQHNGRWHIGWFGALFDGATDDVAAFEGVMSLAPTDRRTECLLPKGVTRWATQLHHNKPVLFIGEGNGEITDNSNGTPTAGTVIQWSGADAATMCVMSVGAATDMAAGTTTGDILIGAGYVGVMTNGMAAVDTYANTFCWHASTVEHVFDIGIRNFRNYGLVGDGGNGALSVRGDYNIHVTWGSVDAVKGCAGLLLRRLNGFPSTQNKLRRIWGLIYDGDGVTFGDTDNNHIEHLHVVKQSGGSGWALRFANGVDDHGRMNLVDYIAGDIRAESQTHGNVIVHTTSEGQVVSIGNGGELHILSAVDYVTYDRFYTHGYKFSEDFDITGLLAADGTVATDGKTAGNVWRATKFSNSATGYMYANFSRSDWSDGEITGITILFTTETAEASVNTRWTVQMSTKALENISTPEKAQSFTVAVANATNFINRATMTFTTPLEFLRDDIVLMRVAREAADALDTATSVVAVLGVVVHYKSYGPNSSGSGPYDVGPTYA